MSRRSVLAATGAASAAVTLPASAAEAGEAKQYVLVHGSGFGSWCWNEVADRLRAQGHRVFTPTLTGLAERRHLRSPLLSLDTHIQDVANLIQVEELDRVILVGHSYSGVVITGVCDQLRSAIRHAVYIDAAAPADGGTNAGGRTLADLDKQFGGLLDGYLLPPSDDGLVAMGMARDDPRFRSVMRRLTPHPMQTWVQPLHLVNGGSVGLPRTFVFCNEAPATSPIRAYAETKRHAPGWNFRELPSGHAAMVTHARETADLLASIA